MPQRVERRLVEETNEHFGAILAWIWIPKPRTTNDKHYLRNRPDQFDNDLRQIAKQRQWANLDFGQKARRMVRNWRHWSIDRPVVVTCSSELAAPSVTSATIFPVPANVWYTIVGSNDRLAVYLLRLMAVVYIVSFLEPSRHDHLEKRHIDRKARQMNSQQEMKELLQLQPQTILVRHFVPNAGYQVGKARLAKRRTSAAKVTTDSPGDCDRATNCSYLTSIWRLSGNFSRKWVGDGGERNPRGI
uniref:Uncharacterized protein n=1 Tax=Romanomermis culicivorax TaxID=13658 RepID=A0A915IL33_ROMCU